ncbi:E3 ubiquitin-protein ligase RNF181 homolog [Phalaenopsis equestris]|uniref:E3 ubiquitin-protein ligase RNF181 homolog n=1 Tax=Phalaenopsis equestris TaxID=78828 RepID=UPI0009E5E545|nr:E3 ubiquitin-protein ligase RNF181 homolog [Phalaenopsis equestris]
MASDSDREAAAFFSHIFRASISADNITEEAQIFNPIIVGLLSGPFSQDQGSPSERPSCSGAGRKGPPPATKASIEAMRTMDMVDSGEECSVCLDEFGQAVVKEMPCKHRFHGDCIDKWLGLHGTCPVCRYCMPADESEPKKVGSDVDGQGEERAIWFEITFGRGEGTGNRDQEQEQEGGEQHVDRNGF